MPPPDRRATLDRVTDPDADARRYRRRQFALGVVGATLGLLVPTLWWATGAARALAAALEGLPGGAPTTAGVVFVAVVLSSALLGLPVECWRGLVLPRRAGLSVQSVVGWLQDRAKAGTLGGLLGLGAVVLLYALMTRWPRAWWLVGTAVLGLGLVALAALAPRALLPLFFRVRPLADPALRDRLLALARRAGVAATDVVVVDASRRGRTANAALAGLGPTRRIVLTDTLLDGFAPDEVAAVLAHELAHHARGHLARSLGLQLALLAAGLGLVHLTLGRLGVSLGLRGPSDPAGVPLVLALAAALGLLATPLVAAWSRRLEAEADALAVVLGGTPEPLVAALERLAALNLAERRPGRVRTWLVATHPPLAERVARARRVPLPPGTASAPEPP
ncbi:MAG: M48 family metalloprotease [Armatimonadota bacterium]|nr:M48 family metalloprotease [Armatimonadota bacterium]MDR7528748.1 M48 family metalloprotease [Armatimonadota bacterium]